MNEQAKRAHSLYYIDRQKGTGIEYFQQYCRAVGSIFLLDKPVGRGLSVVTVSALRSI